MPSKTKKRIASINLLPEDNFEKTSFGKFIKWALSTGRYIVVFTEFIVILAFLSRFVLDKNLSDYYESIDQKKAIISSATLLEIQIRNLNDGFLKIKEVSGKQKTYSNFISFFTTLIPEQVKIDNFSLRSNMLSLSCSSNNPQGLSQFINQLNKSGKFEDISIQRVLRKKDEPVVFDLTLLVKNEAFIK